MSGSEPKITYHEAHRGISVQFPGIGGYVRPFVHPDVAWLYFENDELRGLLIQEAEAAVLGLYRDNHEPAPANPPEDRR